MAKMVKMRHQAGSGEVATVPESAFRDHWSTKGWVLVGEQPESSIAGTMVFTVDEADEPEENET